MGLVLIKERRILFSEFALSKSQYFYNKLKSLTWLGWGLTSKASIIRFLYVRLFLSEKAVLDISTLCNRGMQWYIRCTRGNTS